MDRSFELSSHLGTILSAVALMLGVPQPAECVEPAIPENEYRVWAAVLEHGLNEEFENIVIANTTTGDPAAISRDSPNVEELAGALAIPPATLTDWIRKNQRRSVITRSLPIERAYSLITTEQLFLLFDDEDPVVNWQRFYENHSQTPGLIRVSRVGFDRGLTHAVVYIEFECGAECGSGRLVHLSRDEFGAWQVLSGELLWIAAEKPE